MKYDFFNDVNVFISFEDPVVFLGSHKIEISRNLMNVNIHNIDLVKYFDTFSVDNYNGNITFERSLNSHVNLKYKNIILNCWDLSINNLSQSIRDLIIFKPRFEQLCFEHKEKQSDIEYELKVFYKHIISNSTETLRWFGEQNG